MSRSFIAHGHWLLGAGTYMQGTYCIDNGDDGDDDNDYNDGDGDDDDDDGDDDADWDRM